MSERQAAARALAAAISDAAPAGIRIACRAIEPGDEALLTPREAQSIRTIVAEARDASGAARAIARKLLEDAGITGHSVLKLPSGAPAWPAGIVGSMAHDDSVAVAAIAPATAFSALGIDVEPAEALPHEIVDMVVMPADHIGDVDRRLAGRLLFCAKEAVYKAVFPQDGRVLGFEDIAIDFARGWGHVGDRRVRLAWCLAPRIAVIAFDQAG